ncbi:hypothetical protein Pint_05375 [Pistacia integerrima]|uniref:Uncharacterized protein n=1 Tax=Pistacia integerrima TaxID=434235 RepID=A0ACC0Z6B8_9ROSI|nr:hypothetical protein Pint_05375 [Pistacia integerrima]
MEQRMERLDLEVGKVSSGQEKLLEKVTECMNELFVALSNCIDNLSTPPKIHEGSSQSLVGGVRENQTQFERLLSRAETVSISQQISYFVSGLKVNLQADVKACNPTSLASAIGLARLYEAMNNAQRKTTTEVHKGASSPAILNNRSPMFVPEAVWMEDTREEDPPDLGEEEPTEVVSEVTLEISLHSISGTLTPKTMRLKGTLKIAPIVVLVDFGSTHNFVSEMLTKRAGLQPIKGRTFEVMVISGEKLASPGRCSSVPLSLEGFSLKVAFYLLSLKGYDVVLGT